MPAKKSVPTAAKKAPVNTAEKKTVASKDKTTLPAKPAAKPKPAALGKPVSRSGDPALYTKPELREKLKNQITAGDKGGKPGQWSARKAQLLASEYEKEGGGYKKNSRTSKQKHLESWTEEKWQTADGKKSGTGQDDLPLPTQRSMGKTHASSAQGNGRKKENSVPYRPAVCRQHSRCQESPKIRRKGVKNHTV